MDVYSLNIIYKSLLDALESRPPEEIDIDSLEASSKEITTLDPTSALMMRYSALLTHVREAYLVVPSAPLSHAGRMVKLIPSHIQLIFYTLPKDDPRYIALHTIEGLTKALGNPETIDMLVNLACDTHNFALLVATCTAATHKRMDAFLWGRAFAAFSSDVENLNWIWDRANHLISEFYIGQVFLTAVKREDPPGFVVAEWTVSVARDSISDCVLSMVLNQVKQVTSLEWIYQRFSDRISKNTLQTVFLDAGTSGKIAIVDWLIRQDHILPKTIESAFARSCDSEKYAELRSLLWAYGRPHISPECITATLSKTGPDGLCVLEWAWQTVPECFNLDTLNWAFLKAAVSVSKGRSFAERLCESVPDKISWWTFWRAIQILEKRGHKDDAMWIRAVQECTKGLEMPSPTLGDFKLFLKSSHSPSGYRPLEDSPARYCWLPLSIEELDKVDPSSYDSEDFFADFDAEIVPNESEMVAIHQIRENEARLFSRLYNLIKQGKLPLRIEGDDAFQKMILKCFRLLLGRPSGRWLVIHACRLPHSLRITHDPYSDSYDNETHTIGIDIRNIEHVTKDIAGNISPYTIHTDGLLFHELVHALHYHRYGTFSEMLLRSSSSDRSYKNLEEQFTIAGIDTDLREDLEKLGHAEPFLLSENCYNCERGYPERYGHHAWDKIYVRNWQISPPTSLL
jgi:hypothetical protein